MLRRRKWSIALVALIGTALAIALVAWRPAVYTATARVEVRPTRPDLSLPTSTNMETEAARVRSDPVVALAASGSANAPPFRRAIVDARSNIEVSIPSDTTYLDISCTERSREVARACADAFASAYVTDRITTAQRSYDDAYAALLNQIQQIETQIRAEEARTSPDQRKIDSLKTQRDLARFRQVTLPSPSSDAALPSLAADLPTEPSNKDYFVAGALALLVGIALGIGLAFVRDRLDQRIAGRVGLEETTDAPVLAVVPRVEEWRDQEEARLETLADPDGFDAEAYRLARTALLYRATRDGLQVIEITSAGEREGKTTTTANLAVSLAQTGKTVVAVSCDLRKPRLHRFLGVDNLVGLSNLLAGDLHPGAIRDTGVNGLRIIPSGPVPPNPAELLGSDAMDELIRWLRGKADFLLLDTAPALIVADALAVAPRCDGAVIVADARNTTRGALARVRSELHGVGVPIIGSILNRLDRAQAKRYPDEYGYYATDRYRAEENGSRDRLPLETSEHNLERMYQRRDGGVIDRAPDVVEVAPDVADEDSPEQVDPSERMWRS